MAWTGVDVYLRNDSGGQIVIGTITLDDAESVQIWDTVAYTNVPTVLDNFAEVVGDIGSFNQNIGSGDLVMVVNSVDVTVAQDAFDQFQELYEVYTELDPADREHSILRLANRSTKGLQIAGDGGADLGAIPALTKEPTGFSPTGSEGHPSEVTKVDGTRTLSIAPTGADFEYWFQGQRITVDSQVDVVWADVEGSHYFALDGEGSLLSTQDGSTIGQWIRGGATLVSSIYWDAENSEVILFAEERHGLMDGEAHFWQHRAFGAQWYSGGALTGFSLNQDGSSDTHVQFGVTSVQYADEDLRFSVSHNNPQPLNNPCEVPIFYRSGAAGNWRKKDSDTLPLIYSGTAGYTGANGRIPYNSDIPQDAIEFVNSTTNSVSASTITLTVPSGVQDDDLLVAIVCHAESEDNAFSTPTGWTLVVNELQVGQTPPSVPGTSVYTRVASSEPASYDFVGTFSSGIVGYMLAYRNVSTSTPLDVTTTTSQSTTGGSPNPPANTSVTDDAVFLAIGFKDDGAEPITGLSAAYTSRGIVSTGVGGNGLSIGVCELLVLNAGAEDPGIFTSGDDEWAGITLVLRPSSATAGDWELYEAAEGAYVGVHYWTNNDFNEPVCGIQGQNQYLTLEAATEGAETELSNLRGTVDLLGPEFSPLGTVFYRTEAGYANTAKAVAVRLADGSAYKDFRGNSRRPAPSGGGADAGDVFGPGTHSDNTIAVWDGVNSNTLRDSPVTIDDDGNLLLTTDGSTSTDPRILGFGDFSSPEAYRLQLTLDEGWQSSFGGAVTMYNFNTLILRGNRNVGGAPDFDPDLGIGVLVQGEQTGDPSFVVRGADSQTADLQQWRSTETGDAVLLSVDDEGNIVMAGSQTVDGRDVSTDGSTLDAHVGSTSNPHSTTLANLTDTDLTGIAQGNVLYRNATQWVVLAPGTSGQYLQTQGAGANPQWATPTGSGDVVGPGTHGDNEVPRWNGVDSNTLQTSSITIDDDGNLYLDADGSSTTTPRVFGAINFSDTEAIRWEFGDDSNALQNSWGGSMTMYAYHTIVLRGDRNTSGGPGFETVSDIGVWVPNTTSGSPALVVDGASGQTADLQQWRDNTPNVLVAIDASGNVSIYDGNEVRWYDSGSSNYVGFQAPDLTANQVWTLPPADGTDGQIIQTNGAGVLSFVDPPSGGSGGSPPKYFDAYDTTGGTVISSGAVVPLDTQRVYDTDYFTHSTVTSNSEVTVDVAGTYLVLLRIGTQISTGTSRSASEGWLELDTGSGFTEVPGTRGIMYNREDTEGGTQMAVQAVLALSAGDKLRGYAERSSGTSTIILEDDNSGLMIVKLPEAGNLISVRKNSTGSVFERGQLNLIEGTGVTLTVADDGVDGEVDVTIAASGGGSGDVVGPASATDEALARFDTTTGKLIQSSPVTLTDAGVSDGWARIDFSGATSTLGSLNLPDEGSIYSYSNSADRRLFILTGNTLYVGQNTGTGLVPIIDLEAGTSVTVSIGATDVIATFNETGIDFDVPLDMSGQAIANVGTVDGRDVSADGSTLDSHVGSTSNPHSTTLANLTDTDLTGIVQGCILYRNGTQWVVLTPGTAGQVLQTQGSAANPVWATVSGTGDVVGPASSTDYNLAAFDGTTGKLLREVSGVRTDVNGYLYSIRYVMGSGPDMSLIPVAGGQSVITSWHGLQLVGNKQSTVAYNPSNIGTNNQFGVVVPSQDVDADASFAIVAASAQTGDLFRATDNALAALVRIDVNGNIIFSGSQTVDGVDVSAHASRHNPGGADAVSTAAAVAASIGQSNTTGTATSLARSDHTHQHSAGTPVNVTKASNAAGSATTFARSDHKHDVSTAAAVSVGTVNAEGNSTSLARANHTHAVTGLSIASQAQGDILYRNASAWVRLPAGTSGQFLQTQGAGANPQWASGGSGSGDVVGPASATDNAIARFDTTTGKLIQNSGVTIDDNDNFDGVRTISFDLLSPSAVAHSEGTVFYDSDAHALVVYNDQSAVTHQVGYEGLLRVYNNTGSTIANGSPVYVTGASSGLPTVALAQANARSTSLVIGVATQDISNASAGLTTRFGGVSLNTSGFSAGDRLYLSPTVAGGLTTTRPSGTNVVVGIGYALDSAASGRIDVELEFVGVNSGEFTYRIAHSTDTSLNVEQNDAIWAAAIIATTNTTVQTMQCYCTQGATGNIYFAIYDGSFNLLEDESTGVSCSATGFKEANLDNPVELQAGEVYYLALRSDANGSRFLGTSCTANNLGSSFALAFLDNNAGASSFASTITIDNRLSTVPWIKIT